MALLDVIFAGGAGKLAESAVPSMALIAARNQTHYNRVAHPARLSANSGCSSRAPARASA